MMQRLVETSRTRFFRRGCIALGVTAAALLLFLLYQFVLSPIGYQLVHAAELERRFGFEYGSPYLGEGDCIAELLELSVITPGGAFAAAGIKRGEIVSPTARLSISKFFMLLGGLERGETAALLLRTPQATGCWRDWPERIVTIVAP
ncbi:MAG: hypothetical protein EPO68_16395 [Planctomycetota bacterium]|nr:MAG: hypothetical protein EPO68_16395 [Planctomycetota bacterium]